MALYMSLKTKIANLHHMYKVKKKMVGMKRFELTKKNRLINEKNKWLGWRDLNEKKEEINNWKINDS